MKICWKHVFFEKMQSHAGSSPGEDYFPPSVIWPLLNTKIFVKTSSKRKKSKKISVVFPIGVSSSGEDYFPPSAIWPLLNTKIFVKTSSKRKKFEKFSIVFLFNTGNMIVTT